MLRYIAGLLLAFATLARPLEAQGSPVHQLSWIAGCWRQSNPATGRTSDEQWMAPLGGTMLGMARTVRGDSVVEFEHLQILERGGHAVFHAEPSGQAPADFEARSCQRLARHLRESRSRFPSARDLPS